MLGWQINSGCFYHDMLLLQQLLPMILRLVDCYVMLVDSFTFQQDSTPAHRARNNVRFLEQSTPAFIPPEVWPPNSTDLMTLIWSITRYGVTSSNKCIDCSCTAVMTWRSVCWFSMAWSRASLTMQLISGISIFKRVCGQKADISSNCCKPVIWFGRQCLVKIYYIWSNTTFVILSQIWTLKFNR